jgi:16S rRNA (cytosine1402-N4)-methyltransferase
MTGQQFHQPVLCDEVVQWLLTDLAGTYLDGTVGGGGHAAEILRRLKPSGTYIGIDRDPDAIANCHTTFGTFSNVVLLHGSFAEADLLIQPHIHQSLTGVLLDLGVSSYQLDTPTRGFSYRESGPLDMRMDSQSDLTAADILNCASEAELRNLFRKYGQEKRSAAIARKLVRFRETSPLESTDQLVEIVRATTPPDHRIKSLSRIFQAIRIYVNQELTALEKGLPVLFNLLALEGRMAVISYHSLEDGIVKSFFRAHSHGCICPPELPQCVCGKTKTLEILTRRVVRPSEGECSKNPRARSAKLRVAEKIAV